MSVYTHVNLLDVSDFSAQYAIGDILKIEGIQAGIENTNYHVKTTTGKYILTIFESIGAEKISLYLNLLQQLKEKKYLCPSPQISNKNQLFHLLKNKPAAFFNCISGHSITSPSMAQCEEVGSYLAKLHLYGKDCSFAVKNRYNLAGCQTMIQKIEGNLSISDHKLLISEINFQKGFSTLKLPKGIIHADLFKDNVLFNNEKISGILDFYTACIDSYLVDIAITCNDWCCNQEGVDINKIKALLIGYEKFKPLSQEEVNYLPIFLRFTALRFWLSRLTHNMSEKTSHLTTQKDPLFFRLLLQLHRTNHYDFSIDPAV